jgi:hypothetical protein
MLFNDPRIKFGIRPVGRMAFMYAWSFILVESNINPHRTLIWQYFHQRHSRNVIRATLFFEGLSFLN